MYKATIHFQASHKDHEPEGPFINIEFETETAKSLDSTDVSQNELKALIHDIVQLINTKNLTSKSDMPTFRVYENGDVLYD